jgi:hypothetical protein
LFGNGQFNPTDDNCSRYAGSSLGRSANTTRDEEVEEFASIHRSKPPMEPDRPGMPVAHTFPNEQSGKSTSNMQALRAEGKGSDSGATGDSAQYGLVELRPEHFIL